MIARVFPRGTVFCRDKWLLKEWRIYDGQGNYTGAATMFLRSEY